MIFISGECHNNYDAASWLYVERFPNRRHRTNSRIQNLTQKVAMEVLLANTGVMNITKMMREL